MRAIIENTENRGLRFSGLLDAERIRNLSCQVIGIGAIGRQVALQLAILGVGNIELIDFDTVAAVNLGAQGYSPDDIGRLKVTITANDCVELNPDIAIITHPVEYSADIGRCDVGFLCVDSLAARKSIFRIIKHEAILLIDGRMSAEILRVLTAYDLLTQKYYVKSLRGRQLDEPCTRRSTIYCANIAAGFMVSQLACWLRNLPLRNDYLVNLITKEIFFDVDSEVE